MENNQIIREFYDKQSAYEWERLAQHPFEFEINLRFLKRHIKPGDRVLDVGGGPGRYSFALKELGCDVSRRTPAISPALRTKCLTMCCAWVRSTTCWRNPTGNAPCANALRI